MHRDIKIREGLLSSLSFIPYASPKQSCVFSGRKYKKEDIVFKC